MPTDRRAGPPRTRPSRTGLGRAYAVPEPVLAALVAVFADPSARQVVVIEHSGFARLHLGMAATTRPGRILLSGAGDAFVADPEFVLHEYCHVLRQWGPGRLTRRGYLLESLRRGYTANRFEIEARAFAAATVDRFCAVLAQQSRA